MKILFTILFVSMAFMPGNKAAFDYDNTVDFGEFKTFAVSLPSPSIMAAASAKHPALINIMNENLLQGNIIYQMEGKGYTQSSDPDLMVTFNISLGEEIDYEINTVDVGPGLWGTYYYGGYYGYDGWPGMSVASVTADDFETGSVVIDIVSTKSNKLVWYGANSDVLSGNNANTAADLPAKIEQIFDNYFWTAGQSKPVKRIPGAKK